MILASVECLLNVLFAFVVGEELFEIVVGSFFLFYLFSFKIIIFIKLHLKNFQSNLNQMIILQLFLLEVLVCVSVLYALKVKKAVYKGRLRKNHQTINLALYLFLALALMLLPKFIGDTKTVAGD
jgi:hypothetical protein